MDPRLKAFKITGENIKRLIPNMGACYASDRITVDGVQIGYMYREKPDNDVDSGWRFMAGDETDEYINNPDNLGLYEVNTICNYDPAIIPLLNAPFGKAFARVEGADEFTPEDLATDL